MKKSVTWNEPFCTPNMQGEPFGETGNFSPCFTTCQVSLRQPICSVVAENRENAKELDGQLPLSSSRCPQSWDLNIILNLTIEVCIMNG